MRTLIKNNFKILLKNIFLLVILIAFTVFFCIVCAMKFTANILASDSLYFLFSLLDLSTPLFLFFSFFSYEYFAKAQDIYLDEMAASLYGGKKKLYFSQYAVIFSLIILFSLITLGFAIGWFIFYEVLTGDLIIHILLNVLLNILLSSAAASLFALLCGLYFGRIASYIAMLIATFLVTPFSNFVLLRLTAITGVNFLSIKTYTNILNQDAEWAPDYIYGLPLEQFRWLLIAFVLSVLLVLIILKIKPRGNKGMNIAAAGLSACVIFTGVNIINPGSLLRMDYVRNENISDMHYYYYTAKQETKRAQFSISAYDMELNIDRELVAKVKMTIDSSQPVEDYLFTLYHHLSVSSITDGEGHPLEYTRDGDYIDVKNKTGAALSAIVISYSGSYTGIFSNSQGVWLPAHLCYYPVEGYRVLYDVNIQGFAQLTNQSEKQFDVTVNCPAPMVSNLAGENGKFSGRATAASFFAGLFMQEYTQGSYTIYMSSLESYDLTQYRDLNVKVKRLSSLLGVDKTVKSGTKVFLASTLVSNSDKNKGVFFGDHITASDLTDVNSMAVNIVLSDLVPDYNKYTIYTNFTFFLTNKNGTMSSFQEMFGDSETFELPQRYANMKDEEKFVEQMEVMFWMYKNAQSMKEKDFDQKIYAYLLDTDNRTPELEFIKNLK